MARELTLYAFLPLPVLLLAALLLLARTALVLTLPPLLLFAYFYGPQLLPRHPPEAAGPQLRVLSFNTGGNAGGARPRRSCARCRRWALTWWRSRRSLR